ncbi:MAG: hypothetical protein ACFFE8_07685 [Candidatus Heimdallarchaeota archaeon]
MTNNEIQTYSFPQFFKNRKIMAFVFSIFGMLLIDLFLASQLPFWLHPIIIGAIVGIIIGNATGATVALVGALIGRFSSIITITLTRSGVFETADLFLQVIGETLGVSLPAGSLLITMLSMLFCGLFAFIGGLIGGSITKIVSVSLRTTNESD